MNNALSVKTHKLFELLKAVSRQITSRNVQREKQSREEQSRENTALVLWLKFHENSIEVRRLAHFKGVGQTTVFTRFPNVIRLAT